jgi:hypothetical protein
MCSGDSKVGRLALVPTLSLVVTLLYEGGSPPPPPLDSSCPLSRRESGRTDMDHATGTTAGWSEHAESR